MKLDKLQIKPGGKEVSSERIYANRGKAFLTTEKLRK
jgi:hypothetical protein